MNWKEIPCLNGQVHLKLPEDWGKPSSSMVEKKFPYRQRPQEIFISPDAHHIIAFSILGKALQEQQVYPAILEIQRLISHMYPESIWKPSRWINTEHGMVGWFSFITGGISCDEYHYMFILPVEGKMMLGSYHSPGHQIKEEEMLFLEILKGIRLHDGVEEDKSKKHEESGLRR